MENLLGQTNKALFYEVIDIWQIIFFQT